MSRNSWLTVLVSAVVALVVAIGTVAVYEGAIAGDTGGEMAATGAEQGPMDVSAYGNVPTGGIQQVSAADFAAPGDLQLWDQPVTRGVAELTFEIQNDGNRSQVFIGPGARGPEEVALTVEGNQIYAGPQTRLPDVLFSAEANRLWPGPNTFGLSNVLFTLSEDNRIYAGATTHNLSSALYTIRDNHVYEGPTALRSRIILTADKNLEDAAAMTKLLLPVLIEGRYSRQQAQAATTGGELQVSAETLTAPSDTRLWDSPVTRGVEQLAFEIQKQDGASQVFIGPGARGPEKVALTVEGNQIFAGPQTRLPNVLFSVQGKQMWAGPNTFGLENVMFTLSDDNRVYAGPTAHGLSNALYTIRGNRIYQGPSPLRTRIVLTADQNLENAGTMTKLLLPILIEGRFASAQSQ